MELSAIIDLGTNTFHLLIGRKVSDTIEVVQRSRKYVFLAENGISTIDSNAIKRAKDAFKSFKIELGKYEIQSIRLIGTAALRNASNSMELISQLQDIIPHPIEIISGHQEAEYIAAAVQTFLGYKFKEYLVLDIGGGSNEFIHIKNHEILWRESYNTGIGIISQLDDFLDPMTNTGINKIVQFLDDQMLDFPNGIKNIPLVGASGSFMTFWDIKNKNIYNKDPISIHEMKGMYDKFMYMPLSKRIMDPTIPVNRAPLLPFALSIVLWTINKVEASKLFCSPWALKEGVLLNTK